MTHNNKKACLLLMMSLAAGWAQAEAIPMNDRELDETVAQEGVAIDLEMRWNANADGTPLAAAPYNNCTGNGNGCRIAWQANNRTNEWVVFKDFYMLVRLNNIRLDATTLPAVSSPYADATRFQNSSGVCIVAGCNPNGLPALMLSFAGNATTTEVDYEILANARLSMEVSATGYSADTNQGYNGFRVADSNGAYSAGQNLPAKIDMDGRVMIYGF